MPNYIALFRGINVGGKNKMLMKDLALILEETGYTHVRTYIQSGNVLFQSSHSKVMNFSQDIGRAIREKYGFLPGIMLLDVSELEIAINSNPYPEAEKNPKSLHLYFLGHTPDAPDIKALNQIKSESESFKLIKNVFYLYAPDGIGRSKLVARVERLLGVEVTARNWNTVTKLLEMANEK